MAEVYELAMRIGLTGDILSSLQQISNRLGQIGTQVDSLNARFTTIASSIASLSAATLGFGAGILIGLDRIASYYDDIAKQQEKLIAGGWSETDATKAYSAAMAAATEMHGKVSDAMALMLPLAHQYGEATAGAMLGPVFEAQQRLRRLGDESELAPLVRMWSREGLTPDQLIERVQAVETLVQRTYGQVTASDYARMYGMGGMAFTQMAYKARTVGLPELAYEFPNVARSNLGMLLGEGFVQMLKDNKGKISSVLAPGESLIPLQNDPFEFANALVRGMRSRGETVDAQHIAALLADIGISNQKEMEVFRAMMMKGREVLGAGSPFEQAPTLPKIDLNEIVTIEQARRETAAAVERMFTAMGALGEHGVVLDKWRTILSALEGFSKWVSESDPAKMRKISESLADAAVALTAIGGTALIISGIALMLGPTGLLATAIVGLGYVASEVYKSWDSSLFMTRINLIKEAWLNFINWILNTLRSIPGIGHLIPGGPAVPEELAKPRSALPNDYWRFDQGTPRSWAARGWPTYQTGAWPAGGAPAFRPDPFNAAAMAATTPGRGASKPITAVTNLNINGRLLAQQISDYLIQLMDHSTGAGAADGVGLSHMPDAGFSSN